MEAPKTAFQYSRTVYLTPKTCDALLDYRRRRIAESDAKVELRKIVDLVGPTDTGLCIFGASESVLTIKPPFPLLCDDDLQGFKPEQLLDLLTRDRTVMVILIRLGRYSIGIIHGEDTVVSKSGTRYVKNRHRAGGSSQRRFERSRERLIREFYDHVHVEATRLLNDGSKTTDPVEYVLHGGEAGTIRGFQGRCRARDGIRGLPTLSRLLSVNLPNHKAMQSISTEVYSSLIFKCQKTIDSFDADKTDQLDREI